jgi:predicted N-acyltransferase
MLQGAREIPSAAWNKLAHRGFHLHDWFTAAEDSGWTPRHVAVERGEDLRAVVPAYLTHGASMHDLHDRWLGPLRELASMAGLRLRPIISVQAPFALVSEPLGDPYALSPDLLHQVFEILEAFAIQDGAKAVVWPCVDPAANIVLQVAEERGYAAVYGGSTARLQIAWETFDEYVSSRSKSVRRTIRKDLEGLDSAGLRVETVSQYEAAVPAMNALFCEAFRRRNGKDAALQPEFFGRLARRNSNQIRAQLTWSGARLVGSSINLNTPDLLEGTLSAFSREHHSGPAYHNDLCYEPIRVACREGIAAIDLGATALYTKVLRGARLRRRITLVRGTTRIGHQSLSTLGAIVARRTEWKERRALGSLWHHDQEEAGS